MAQQQPSSHDEIPNIGVSEQEVLAVGGRVRALSRSIDLMEADPLTRATHSAAIADAKRQLRQARADLKKVRKQAQKRLF